MPLTPVIAIFDIGKTNKKVFLFDQQYNIVFEESEVFPENVDEDGFPCDDLRLLKKFVIDHVQALMRSEVYDVRAINFSGYGASFVHIDAEGKELTPLYNYLKPLDEGVSRRFVDQHGEERVISRETASPILGNLNSGMQLFGLKCLRPEVYSAIKYSLHLPQYLSWIISGKPVSEITSIGCHTLLWDYEHNEYHPWVKLESLVLKFPETVASGHAFLTDIKGKQVYCGIGLHDSSSALVPYLKSFQEPFMLISTGTWNICLNPFDQTPLTEKELERDCLCYKQYNGRSVKASRLFAGDYHAKGVAAIADHFGVDENFFRSVRYDNVIAHRLQDSNRVSDGVALTVFNPSIYPNAIEAYHALVLQIVLAQLDAARLVMHGEPVKNIYVDGGFSKNELFMSMLSKRMSGIHVFAAEVAQASALGAAIAVHSYWNESPLNDQLIDTKIYFN